MQQHLPRLNTFDSSLDRSGPAIQMPLDLNSSTRMTFLTDKQFWRGYAPELLLNWRLLENLEKAKGGALENRSQIQVLLQNLQRKAANPDKKTGKALSPIMSRLRLRKTPD